MTEAEEAAAKLAKEKADKEAAEKAAADAAKGASDAAAAASKKEKEYWTNAHNELKMRVDEIEEGAPRSWLAILAVILGGFSALVILLAFVASLARRTPPSEG